MNLYFSLTFLASVRRVNIVKLTLEAAKETLATLGTSSYWFSVLLKSFFFLGWFGLLLSF